MSIAQSAIATAVFATALLPVSASAQVLNPDRAALQALYEAAGGDNWDRDDNWLTDAPLDEWYGVDATGTGQVLALSLPDNNLTGHLPPEIGNLSRLERLDLHRNWRPGPSSIGLTGRIPPEIGNLSNLSDLNLSSNELIGTVPTELAELTNLVRLDIGYNDLTGRIPIELTALPSLAVFDLGFNNLTGSIPPEIAAMTTLTDLNLGGNGLSGGIPRALGNLSLSNLDLGFNNLTGGIPPELGDITTLRTLVLWNNRGLAPTIADSVTGKAAFEIDEFCQTYISTELNETMKAAVARVAYESGIEHRNVHNVLRVVLRDELLHIATVKEN